MEMGIPLVLHPKHTYSKIHGLSESESSSDWEDELDDFRLSKDAKVEADSNKDIQNDQNSSPTLVIYWDPLVPVGGFNSDQKDWLVAPTGTKGSFIV